MSSDCYAILGVTPDAEDVVIGAAYRALIRHYHPDTNPDPDAQARAREITAAYAVLRNPASRAEYDAKRAEGVELWPEEEEVRRPPPMRAAGIATALLAVGLVGAVWVRAPHDQQAKGANHSAPAPQVPSEADPAPGPPTRLEPETDRLARLAGTPPPSPSTTAVEADLAPVTPTIVPSPVVRQRPIATTVEPRIVRAAPAKPPEKPVAAAPKAPVSATPPQADRVAALGQMSSGFFSQSWSHADEAKRALLVAARDRSAAERRACRSDSCVADAYVRQIRATSAIMEARAGPRN